MTRVQTLFAHCLILFVLSGCVQNHYQSLTEEADFISAVVDRPLSWPGGYAVRFTADGVISGQFPQGRVSGQWQWRNGQFCRTISINDASRPDECLTIEVGNGQVRFRRSDGSYFLPYRIGEQGKLP